MAEYSVKVRDVKVTEREVRKAAWNSLLGGLRPWELHWFISRELELHDQFVNGELEMADVERVISDAFPEVR